MNKVTGNKVVATEMDYWERGARLARGDKVINEGIKRRVGVEKETNLY